MLCTCVRTYVRALSLCLSLPPTLSTFVPGAGRTDTAQAFLHSATEKVAPACGIPRCPGKSARARPAAIPGRAHQSTQPPWPGSSEQPVIHEVRAPHALDKCVLHPVAVTSRHRHTDVAHTIPHASHGTREFLRLRSRLPVHLHNDLVAVRHVLALCDNSIHNADQTFHPRRQSAASGHAFIKTREGSRLTHVLCYLGPSPVCPIITWPPKIKLAVHTAACVRQVPRRRRGGRVAAATTFMVPNV